MSTLVDLDYDLCGNGYVDVYDGDTKIAQDITLQRAHDQHGLEVDCHACKKGAEMPHPYEEPYFSDLTDCIDGCGAAIDHDGPCSKR